MFNLNTYRQLLHTRWLGHEVDYFKELKSTNSYLKELDRDRISHGQLCVADFQTAGRGQYERRWESRAGQNLTFTLAFIPPKIERFHVLKLTCAHAIVAQIEETLGCKAVIKWPNDIMINGKKVAGLLTETVFKGNKFDRLLVGIGLNVNQQKFSAKIRDKTISLQQAAGSPVGREEFLSGLLSRLEYEYRFWHKRDDALLKAINKKIIGYGQWMRLQVDGRLTTNAYKVLGINHQGQFTAISKKGDVKTFSYEQIRITAD